jgi:hypothetical protein
MNRTEFESKLKAIPEVEPDELDNAIIAEAAGHDDGGSMPLNEFKTLMDFNGKLSLRIPRSLHMQLVNNAKTEGVSLNQYALYKLAK